MAHTRRKLDNSLCEQLSIDVNKKNKNLEKRQVTFNIKNLYGVLRSKGGSGEKHIVKKLVNELLDQNKIVFICLENYINEDDYYIQKYLPFPVNKLININDVDKSNGGVLNLDWKDNTSICKLFSIIKNTTNCAVVFSCGTGSGGTLFERSIQLSRFCEKIYISINSDVANSIEPAKRLSAYQEIDQNKIQFCLWTEEVAKENINYCLDVSKSDEFKRSNIKKLKERAINRPTELLITENT